MMNSRPTRKPEAPRGPFRNLRASMARFVNSKGFIALVSVMTAILAWSALVASDGTLTRHRSFSNVTVDVTGETTLKSRGYIVMDDIEKLVPGVKMTVEVAQQNYNRVSGTAYNPHFDLSRIDGEGEQELTISFSSTLYGPVVSCEPSSITVNVERYMTRRVPVVLEMTGALDEGLYLDSYKLDPMMLSVSGPKSLVTTVSRAVAKLDLAALHADRMSDRTAVPITLQNSKGEDIHSDKLEVTNQTVITDSVVVDTEMTPVKHVPLLTEDFVSGKPAKGFELVGIYLGETALDVAAKQEALDAIEFITTDAPLDIEGASQNVSGYVKPKRPAGVENTLPGEIAVTAEIAEKTIERTLRSVTIQVSGLGSGLKASQDSKKATVQLTGPYSLINGLKAEDVYLFVDAGGLGEGEHVLPVQIRIDNAGKFSCALSVPEVALTIKAQ